jgi:hypothetical protein
MFRHALFAATLAAPCVAPSAQQQALPAPTVDYRSAFDGYRPWRVEPRRDWREVNAEVGRLGGHAGHLRAGAAAPAAAPTPATGSRPTPPAQSGQGAHHGHAPEPRR